MPSLVSAIGYRLGVRCLALGQACLEQTALRLETTHALGLMSSRVGRTAPSYCTGSGKALLAGLAGDPVAILEDSGALRRYTANTIYEPDALRDELEKIRERGYSPDLEEHELGVRRVAREIRGAVGDVVASVSISGPAPAGAAPPGGIRRRREDRRAGDQRPARMRRR